MVLDQCRRRCCVCFSLNGDGDVKSGQIAHLDRDPSNNSLGNLVFLCFAHHDQYDSKTSQAKNLTAGEVCLYRAKLHEAVQAGRIGEPEAAKVIRLADCAPSARDVTVVGDRNIVSGRDTNLTVNMPRSRSRGAKPPVIPGTVAEDARMIGYLRYLAKRYQLFKEWDCRRSGERMRYPLIYKAYERETGYPMPNTPKDMFGRAAEFLQCRIQNTRLGRNRRGQKLFRTFAEFDDRAKPNEDMPAD